MAASGTAQCPICPRQCTLAPGERGFCRARWNKDGIVTALTYGKVCALHVDPVEKKPLFHFLPASTAFSIATTGCNLRCRYCQNWEISQANLEDVPYHEVPPEKVVDLALQYQCKSIAYTYTEPMVSFEFVRDCAAAAHRRGLRNILVTSGHYNPGPFKELRPHLDAATITLKGMTEDFYDDVCSGMLAPVLATLQLAIELELHVEVVNLVVPTLNDTPEQLRALATWVVDHLGPETPLHFSRFHPDYRMRNLPDTPEATLTQARTIALERGLHHVYLGNVLTREGETTVCPKCHRTLIRRRGFEIVENALKAGACPDCNTKIKGVWQ